MKKTLAIIGGAIAVLVAAVFIFAATKPDTFRVQRAASMKAPPEKIYALLSDFHGWEAWQGNGKVGQGSMEITEAAAPSRVVMDLDFIKPFPAHNKVDSSSTTSAPTARRSSPPVARSTSRSSRSPGWAGSRSSPIRRAA